MRILKSALINQALQYINKPQITLHQEYVRESAAHTVRNIYFWICMWLQHLVLVPQLWSDRP